MEYTPSQEPSQPEVDPDINCYSLVLAQMNQEMINSRVYKNFSGICDLKGLLGAEKYFLAQSEDECIHHKKLYDYICSKGWIPKLSSLPEEEINLEWTLVEMFAQAVQLEKDNLKLISNIQKKALVTSDFETFEVIGWFTQNQTAEINEMTKWLQKFNLASESPAALLYLDELLGED